MKYIQEIVGMWLTFAVALTLVVPPVGLFLLGFLFAFVYPLLLLVIIAVWVVGGFIKLFKLIAAPVVSTIP
jgi:hypothetical protein